MSHSEIYFKIFKNIEISLFSPHRMRDSFLKLYTLSLPMVIVNSREIDDPKERSTLGPDCLKWLLKYSFQRKGGELTC